MTGRQRADRLAGLAFVAPAALTLAALALYPGLWVLWLSLQQRIPIFGIARFVGLDHYAFLATDPRFWNAARVTVVFTGVSVALELVLGLAVALALERQRRGRRLALSLLLLAWALPSVVTAKLFEWLYHPSAGLVNLLLGRPLNWLGDPALALPGLIAADVWRTMPFVALLCFARLVTIPPEVYEAARLDGAGRWATLAWITLPLLRSILLVALLFRTLDALRAFDLMYVLTGGGPANSTHLMATYAYSISMGAGQMGLGSAVALSMVPVLGLLLVLLTFFVRKD